MVGDRRRGLAWLLLLLVAGVLLPALQAGYVHDDRPAILDNPHLRSWGDLPGLFLVNYWGRERNIGLYRPLVQSSYLLERQILGGFDSRLSHLINLLLHLVCVFLFYRYLLAWQHPLALAFWSALLFGVHPALLDADVWISGRTDLMATALTLGGLLLARGLKARSGGVFSRGRVALGLLFFLALLSKEMAITLPLLLLIFEGRRSFLRAAPWLLMALVAYLALRFAAVQGFLPSGSPTGVVLTDQDLLARLVIGARAMLRLLVLLPLPFGLAASHRADPWALPGTSLGVSSVLAPLVLLGMAWGGWRLWRRGQLAGACLLALVASLLPLLQVVPIGAVMAERFLYLPALFVLPLMVQLSFQLPWRRVRFLVLVLTFCLLSGITWSRLPVYHNDGAFFQDVLAAYPQDHKAWNNLAVFYWEARPPRFEQAARAFSRALAQRPHYLKGRLNLARLQLDWDRAAPAGAHLNRAQALLAPLSRRNPLVLYLLAKIHLRLARREPERRQEYLALAYSQDRMAARRFLKSHPPRRRRAAMAWKDAGLAAARAGLLKQAQEAFREAHRLGL